MGLHGIRELRRDVITGRWVVMNSALARVPGAFSQRPDTACPICTQQNANGLFERRDESSVDWRVKAVPVAEPALRVEGSLDGGIDGVWENRTGVGANELIIETPRHGLRLADLPQGRIRDVFEALRSRMLDLRRDQRMKHFSVFRQPRTNGAWDHGVWELIGLPVMPDRWLGESTRTYRYWEQHGSCCTCDLVTRELAAAARIIAADDEAITLAPYASRHPFEVWILPRKHGSHFENAIDAQLDAAALALENLARQMDAVLERPDLLITLQTAGSQEIGHHGLLAHSHWRIEVVPMLLANTAPAAAGQFFVNPVPPEEAAKYLRQS